jgi:cell division protein FtsW
MMPTLSRADTSMLGRWWWTVDRWTLAAIASLIFFGYVMMLAASPAVAERIHTSRDIFILKQLVFLAISGGVVVGVSLLSPRGVKRLALAGCTVALALTAMTLVAGLEIKGARRWISLPGMSLQPSEFLKPCFAVTAAWLLSEGLREETRLKRLAWPGLALGVLTLIAVLLRAQPDMGMMAVILGVFTVQLFVNGLNLALVAGAIGLLGAGAVGAFFTVRHFHDRVMLFWSGDNWQVAKSLEAFGAGGLLGRGPGEGHVKDIIPDAHADFVFAVAGEEFGMVVCGVIVLIFAFVVLRALVRVLHERDAFVVLAATGLAAGFGMQALINMASTLGGIPTKGMTLPFISYGGSSAVAVALGVGMLLALTRKRQNGDLL